MSLPVLQLAKGANIAHNAAEIVPATNGLETFPVRRIKRYAQLIEPGGDQRTPVAFAEDCPVGVEQDVSAAILQISHHARQVCDQHRLADAMQHGPRKIRHLIDNRCEQVPIHIRRRLEVLVGAGTGGAQQIAAIGDFQIDADRRADGDLGALALYRFVVAARIDARVNNRVAAGSAHCDRLIPAALLRYVSRADQMHARRKLPNKIDLMIGFGMWNSQYSSLVSRSAPIETIQVGAPPQRATNGMMGRKCQGRLGDTRSKTTSNSIFVSARLDAIVLSGRRAAESIITSTIDAATAA